MCQYLGYVATHNFPCQTFCNRGFAYARFAHQHRIVFAPTREHLNGAQHFRFAPDQRIEPPFLRHAIEVLRIFVQCCFRFFLGRFAIAQAGVRCRRSVARIRFRRFANAV